MSYQHFTPEQRNELSALKRAGMKQNKIADILGKTPSAVSQELKRNSTGKRYDAGIAKRKTRERRSGANQRFRKLENNEWLRNYVVRKIKDSWSPEQISGRMKKMYPDDKDRNIGKDSIYKHIHCERKDLARYLRCQKGRYRRRYGTRIREKRREEMKKKRIDTRPPIVETKERIGDWEGDTIVGDEKSIHILTHVDRSSGESSLLISWRGLRRN